MSSNASPVLTLQELPELRRKTESISKILREQLTGHLETLRPLFAPDRLFGKSAGGKVDVSGAERALAELQQSYRRFTERPYGLPADFDTNWLTLVGTALTLEPWEYQITLNGKSIAMTSPIKWLLVYRSNYSLAQVKKVLAGAEPVRLEYLRQFVVNALVLQVGLHRNPGLGQLFQDLRYELKNETTADLKGLPIVTVTSCLTSFRPGDDLILAATAFSGIPAFIELLDTATLQQPPDPLYARLNSLLK